MTLNLQEIAARIMELGKSDPMNEDEQTEMIELSFVLASYVVQKTDRYFRVTLSDRQHALVETLLRQLVDDHAAGDDESHAENEDTLAAFMTTTEEVR